MKHDVAKKDDFLNKKRAYKLRKAFGHSCSQLHISPSNAPVKDVIS